MFRNTLKIVIIFMVLLSMNYHRTSKGYGNGDSSGRSYSLALAREERVALKPPYCPRVKINRTDIGVVPDPVMNKCSKRQGRWDKTCEAAELINEHFHRVIKINLNTTDPAILRHLHLTKVQADCASSAPLNNDLVEELPLNECRICSLKCHSDPKLGVTLECHECRMEEPERCRLSKMSDKFRVSTKFFDSVRTDYDSSLLDEEYGVQLPEAEASDWRDKMGDPDMLREDADEVSLLLASKTPQRKGEKQKEKKSLQVPQEDEEISRPTLPDLKMPRPKAPAKDPPQSLLAPSTSPEVTDQDSQSPSAYQKTTEDDAVAVEEHEEPAYVERTMHAEDFPQAELNRPTMITPHGSAIGGAQDNETLEEP